MTLNRLEAIQIITKEISDCPIVAANGFLSRDLFEFCDKKSNFYMIGSMGLASSIALGVAIKNPQTKVFVFDGDGNILMNLGSLTTIGTLRPKNLVHVVFDNSSHASTGGQPTNTDNIDIGKIAKAANYKVFIFNSAKKLTKSINTLKNSTGPTMILIKISKQASISKRVSYDPPIIKKRFQNSLI